MALITAGFEAKKAGLANGAIVTISGDFQYFPSIENHDLAVELIKPYPPRTTRITPMMWRRT